MVLSIRARVHSKHWFWPGPDSKKHISLQGFFEETTEFIKIPVKTATWHSNQDPLEKGWSLPQSDAWRWLWQSGLWRIDFPEHDWWASNFPLSMIKHELRPANRPGQARLCLPPPLAPVPGKVLRKHNSKPVQILFLFSAILSANQKCQHSVQRSVPSTLGVAHSGPYCCRLSNLWTGVSFTCLLLIGGLRKWDHTS